MMRVTTSFCFLFLGVHALLGQSFFNTTPKTTSTPSAPSAGSSNVNAPATIFSSLETDEGVTKEEGDPSLVSKFRTLKALTTPDYPVTPGDSLVLRYLRSTQTMSLTLQVDVDYSVNLAFLGRVDALGMSYRELKAKIESVVEKAYPGSSPNLVLSSTGAFDVMLVGHVERTGLISAWGLTRVSELISGLVLKNASLRNVFIRSASEKGKAYDLFAALRLGDLQNDPYVRPGDRVELRKGERFVRISGAVSREGVYELLPGEGIIELIYRFSDGLTQDARPEFSSIVRVASGSNLEGGVIFFDSSRLDTKVLPSLFDGDEIHIPRRETYLPVVYFEGAIVPVNMKGTQGSFPKSDYTYYIERRPFSPGDMLSRNLLEIADRISPDADMRHTYLVRKGKSEPIFFDLERILYSFDPKLEMALEPEDRIVIPYGYSDVFVTGEVIKSSWLKAAALTRLSAVVVPLLTKHSSIRDIVIKNAMGDEKSCDLFRAERDGDQEQDPFLKPGDQVKVGRLKRLVTLVGEVIRPGTYQLLDGEGIVELIGKYGAGLTREARVDFATLLRRATEGIPEGEALFLDMSSSGRAPKPALFDGDTLSIPSRESYLPVVYYEGAISNGTDPTKSYSTERQPFKPGDRLSRSLISMAKRLLPDAALRRAFVLRKDLANPIPVDLEKIMFAYDPAADIELAAQDRIVIPFGSLDVFVTGEVTKSVWIKITDYPRLSVAVIPLLTKDSSVRDILIASAEGATAIFDLFRAERDGEVEQDPFLRPGDRVIINRRSRSATISGEIKRPGTYQILPGEGLRELIDRYGGGLTMEARADYANLQRRASIENPEGGAVFFDALSLDRSKKLDLTDGDTVFLPSRGNYLPVVYYEGAILSGNDIAKQFATDRQPFKPGDLLSRSLRDVATHIAPGADLRRAFIVRKGASDIIPVDLEKILYAYEPAADVKLASEDRIMIPYGSLDVFVTGEVQKSTWVNAAVLTRLSMTIGPLLTKYSSIRDVAIKNAAGIEKEFDLFRAERYGELEQDPFLVPGDIVTVRAFSVAATILGEVRRPGTYQLLPGEGLVELVEIYALGFTDQANPERISLTQSPFTGHSLGATRYINYNVEKSFAPTAYDTFSVPSLASLRPVAYFEGAIRVEEKVEALVSAKRLPYQFVPGEMLSQAVQTIRKGFTAESDLPNAYVIRAEKRIPVNIADLIFRMDFSKDLELQADDIVIIPFRQFFVSVSGAVYVPGRYPYIPDRNWEYYLGLAGGLDEERNTGKAITIVDVNGMIKSKQDLIDPEDTITAKSNSFLYLFGRISVILTTVISVTSLVLSLRQLGL